MGAVQLHRRARFDMAPGVPYTAHHRVLGERAGRLGRGRLVALHRPAGAWRRPPADRPLRLPGVDVNDTPQGGGGESGSRRPTEDGPIIAGLTREGCMIPAGNVPVRLGLEGPGRGGRVRPRRLADHLPGGVHPRQRAAAAAATPRSRSPPMTIHNAVATIRDDVDADAAASTARCSRAAGGGPATSSSSTRVRRDRDQRRHGHAGRHAARRRAATRGRCRARNVSAARLRARAGWPTGAQTVSVTVKDAAGNPAGVHAHGQRRRHAAVGAAAAAVGAYARS